jgi:hypothetical protein
MKIKADFSDAIKHLGIRGGVAIRYSWIGLLFFILTLNQTSVFADYHTAETIVHHQSTPLLSDISANSEITPYHLPFELDLSQQVKEAPDENELEEDFEEECALHTEQEISIFPSAIFYAGNSIIAKRFSILNRASIPFFILYHSWKSFIA